MIVQTILEIKSGRKTLEEAIPEGADPVYWQRLVDNYRPATKKRRNPRRRAGSRSRRTNHAAQVIGRAMLGLVERVNGSEGEQTFASGIDWDAPLADDEMASEDFWWQLKHGLADQAVWPEPMCADDEVPV